MNEAQQKIIDLFNPGDEFASSDIHEKLGGKKRTIVAYTAKLVRTGYLMAVRKERIVKGTSVYYRKIFCLPYDSRSEIERLAVSGRWR